MLVNPIDLNADLGEGFPNDEALLDRVTSASICCGAHAGDRRTAALTIRAGHARGVTLGAHPGYPDRERFGRRPWQTTAEEVETLVRRQLRALFEWAEDEGAAIRFLKPHGALYQQAQVDAEVASGIVAAAINWNLPILGQPRSAVATETARAGLRFVAEGFADRRYTPEGRLTPRTQPNALITDLEEAADQAVSLARAGLETICLHGDEPSAVSLAERLRDALRTAGIAVRSFLDEES